jgi:hypothetical protein
VPGLWRGGILCTKKMNCANSSGATRPLQSDVKRTLRVIKTGSLRTARRINYLSHFTGSSNAVTVEYLDCGKGVRSRAGIFYSACFSTLDA